MELRGLGVISTVDVLVCCSQKEEIKQYWGEEMVCVWEQWYQARGLQGEI